MKLNSIQILRGIAALLVVYVHSIDLQMQFSVSRQQNFFYLQNFGAIGVDLFFVISGFIISLVANNYAGSEQGFLFLAKRFRRINPIYYIASGLNLVILIIFYRFTAKSIPINIGDTINSVFDTALVLPVSGQASLFKPLLMIGWSLSFEWLFYLLFFILILLKVNSKSLIMGLVICALAILGYLIKAYDFRYTFVTNPIMLEFVTGIIIYWFYSELKQVPTWLSLISLLVGILCFVALIVFGFGLISELSSVLTAKLSLKRFFLWGIPSALIVFGCVFLEKNNYFKRAWNNKWMLLTGDASYSIYLIHLTVFLLFALLYKKWKFFMSPDLAIIVQVVIAILISIIFYKWIEKPIIKSNKTNKKFKNSISAHISTTSPAAVP